jgi:hypothetical protein
MFLIISARLSKYKDVETRTAAKLCNLVIYYLNTIPIGLLNIHVLLMYPSILLPVSDSCGGKISYFSRYLFRKNTTTKSVAWRYLIDNIE